MRQSFTLPSVWDSETIWPYLATLSIDGLTGWTIDPEHLHAEFPEREELTDEEQAALAAHVAAYVHTPTWTEVRTVLRPPLLDEADKRINRAEDTGEDTMPLRAYRQALRDITDPPNTPDNFTWPTKPW